jgi:DNA-binding NtrC family response regulator
MGKKSAPENSQKTILVVDDDPYNLESLSAWLSESGYKVFRAASVAEACRQSTDYTNEIHLLMSNFEIAGMSGVDLATRMRGQRPRLKVLLMSGFTEGMLLLHEGWHFLPKPHVHSHLHALIGGLISQPEARTELAPGRTGTVLNAAEKSRSAGRRIPTGGKSPRPSGSDYRRQSPRAAGRPSRGPRESSR